MSRVLISSIVLAGALACNQSAKADPVSLQLTLTTDSTTTLTATFLEGAAQIPVPVDISGTIDITIDDALYYDEYDPTNDSTSISFNDAEINFSDESASYHVGLLGDIDLDILGLGINTFASNGPIGITTIASVDPYGYTFDPAGGSPTQVSIDVGTLTYRGLGPIGGAIGEEVTFDFALDPINTTLFSVGQVGLITQDVGGPDPFVGYPGYVDVTVSAPISFSSTLATDPVDFSVDLSGVIYATGRYIVPEPSSVVLLGIALVGFIPLWRRFHTQR